MRRNQIGAVGAVLFVALAAWAPGCGGGGKAKGQDGGPMSTSCRNSLDCSRDMVCDPSIAQCVGCVTANDCPADNDCTARTCVPYTTCTNSLDCPKNAVCNTATSRCVACLMDADCADDTKTCVANVCRTKCDSDRTCTPLGMLCDLTSGSCAQCLRSADCGSGKYCQGGSCQAAVCTPGQTACMLNAIATCNAVGDGYSGAAVPCDPMTCQMGATGATCVSGAPDGGGGRGGDGATGTGGAGGTSGTSGAAGTTGTGGGAAGTSGVAGTSGAAGATGTGGVSGTSGAAGTTGSGGVTGTAGTTGSAGTTGAGGSSVVTCPSAFTATTSGWVLAAASGGCWHGYAYNFADANGTTITPGTSMTYATCGATCSLTAMGTVTAATLANSYLAYAGIGFKINQPMSAMGPDSGIATLTPKGSGLTISYTGTVGSGIVLRAEISDGTTRWCRNLGSSPSSIAYSSFNTACWDTVGGVAYNKQPISEFQFIVVGGAVAAGYNVSLTGVVETP